MGTLFLLIFPKAGDLPLGWVPCFPFLKVGSKCFHSLKVGSKNFHSLKVGAQIPLIWALGVGSPFALYTNHLKKLYHDYQKNPSIAFGKRMQSGIV